MELANLPNWVNHVCLAETLRNTLDDERKLQSYAIVPVSKAGHVPAAFRVHCTMVSKDDSTVTYCIYLKTTLKNESPWQFTKIVNKLQNELQMYDLFLPEYSKLYALVNSERKFAPKQLNLIGVGRQLSIYFEDLESSGYKQADPIKGMDFKHIKAVLWKLGELHAASVVVNQRGMQCMAQNHVGLCGAQSSEYFIKRSSKILSAFTAAMKNGTKYARNRLHLLPTVEQFSKELKRLFERNNSEATFCVLNHGELCCKNIYFKYAGSEISDVVFANYHLCQYAPPTYDLYLLMLTCHEPVWKHRMNTYHYVKEYEASLRRNLELLKYKGAIPRFKELENMMMGDRFYAFFFALTYLPLALMPSDKRYTLEDLMENDEVLSEVMQNTTYITACTNADAFFCLNGGWW